MNLKKLRLSILLDLMSILVVFIGFCLMVTSCRTIKDTTTTSVTTHIETLDTDTTYQDGITTFSLIGDSSNVVGNDIQVLVRDSIVIRDSVNLIDSIVYRYKVINADRFKVNHPPVYAFTKYGYAKGWIDNNDLKVSMIVHDSVITSEIDSAVQIITNTLTIVETSDTVIDTVKTKVPFFQQLHSIIFLLICLILLVIGIVIYLKYGRKLLR